MLPNEPITAANFQTQPALAAYVKNVFIYFVPIYAVFVLLIYCLISRDFKVARSTLYPLGFFIILLSIITVSYFSTNRLSDNLLTEKGGTELTYHGLFFSLLVFRAIFCFAAPLGSVIWYFIVTLNRLPHYGKLSS